MMIQVVRAVGVKELLKENHHSVKRETRSFYHNPEFGVDYHISPEKMVLITPVFMHVRTDLGAGRVGFKFWSVWNYRYAHFLLLRSCFSKVDLVFHFKKCLQISFIFLK